MRRRAIIHRAVIRMTLPIIAALLTVPVQAGSKSDLLDTIMKIESDKGVLSMALYDPLHELGLTLLDNGEHERALDTFRRMQHLVHRHRGVHAPDQIESVERIIDAYEAMRDYRQLEIQHEFVYRVAKRNFEPEDPRMHEARIRLARWYRNTARFDRALDLYRTSLSLVGEDNVRRRVALLRAEALTLYLAGNCCASENLSEVESLVRESDQFDFQDKKQAALDYADMLMMERGYDKALSMYAGAHAMPGRNARAVMLGLQHPRAVRDAIINGTMKFSTARTIIRPPSVGTRLFTARDALPASIGDPVPVCSTTVREVLGSSSSASLKAYFIDVDVEIDARGRARRIDIGGNAPPGLNRYVRAVLTETHYRPRTTATGPAQSSHLSFRQTFSPERPAPMTDDLSGWNALMNSQTCQLVERAGLHAMQTVAAD